MSEKEFFPHAEINQAEKKKNPEVEEEKLRELIRLSPKDLANFFVELEEKEELEWFLEKALSRDFFQAHLATYQKWIEHALEKGNKLLLEEIIALKKEQYPQGREGLPLEFDKKFKPEELRIIAANLRAVQLSFGCEGKCPWCGFDAPEGVREQLPFVQFVELFKQYGAVIKESLLDNQHGGFTPYHGSELSQYQDTTDNVSKGMLDVLETLDLYLGLDEVHVTIRQIPEDEAVQNKLKETSYPRISLLGYSTATGEKRKVRAKKFNFSISGDVGMEPRQLGMRYEESGSETDKVGIGMVNGFLLTPRGLYNVLQTRRATEKFPQAQIIVPFEGFNPREGKEELKNGENIAEYLPNAVILLRYKNENAPEPEQRDHCFLFHGGKIKDACYDRHGKIFSVKEFSRGEYTKNQEEELKDFARRLNAEMKLALNPEEIKKIGAAILSFFDVNLSKDRQALEKFFEGFKKPALFACLKDWPENKLELMFSEIVKIVEKINIFSLIDDYYLAKILTEASLFQPKILKECFKDKSAVNKFFSILVLGKDRITEKYFEVVKPFLRWCLEEGLISEETKIIILRGLEGREKMGKNIHEGVIDLLKSSM